MAYGAGLESQLGAISQGFESLILRQIINYAVAVGFEPTEDISTFTRFRGVYLWPLRHTTKVKIHYFIEDLILSLFLKYGCKALGM